MKILFSLLALALTFTLHAEEKLTIKGSNTLGTTLVPKLSEAWRASGRNVKFFISAEGSSTAFPALLNGKADIGMSSRKITAEESAMFRGKGAGVIQTVLCMDGIAVIVNAANPVRGLTKAQVRQILSGEITDWKTVGGTPGTISVFTRTASSGTYIELQRLAMSQHSYAAGARKMAGNEQIAAQVAKNPHGIGYVSLAFSHHGGTKTLPIDGVLPGEKAVRSLKYPYGRETYLYTTKGGSAAARDFVSFCTGPSAVRVIREVGFVPSR
jgi:phosphate transport system substrate-binding protein